MRKAKPIIDEQIDYRKIKVVYSLYDREEVKFSTYNIYYFNIKSYAKL